MVRLNLSLDNVRNCEGTIMFVKECEKSLNARRNEFSIWNLNQDFYLKGLFESYKFKEMYKGNSK